MQMPNVSTVRQHIPRRLANLVVDYVSDNLQLRALVADMNEDCAYVETPLLDIVGTRVTLSIGCFPEKQELLLTGQVAATMERPWQEGHNCMVIQFDRLPQTTRDLIRCFCHEYACQWRIALVDSNEERVRRLGREIVEVGLKPIWLPPVELTRSHLMRIMPHIVALRWPDQALRGAQVIEPLLSENPNLRLPVLLMARSGWRGRVPGVYPDDVVAERLLQMVTEAIPSC